MRRFDPNELNMDNVKSQMKDFAKNSRKDQKHEKQVEKKKLEDEIANKGGIDQMSSDGFKKKVEQIETLRKKLNEIENKYCGHLCNPLGGLDTVDIDGIFFDKDGNLSDERIPKYSDQTNKDERLRFFNEYNCGDQSAYYQTIKPCNKDFVFKRGAGGGKSGALVMFIEMNNGNSQYYESKFALKLYLNAYNAYGEIDDDRPFREMYSQCKLSGKIGFNCLLGFGSVTRENFLHLFTKDKKDLTKFFWEKPLPQKIAYMATTFSPGKELMKSDLLNPAYAHKILGCATMIWSTYERAQEALGTHFHHFDMHPENIYVDWNCNALTSVEQKSSLKKKIKKFTFPLRDMIINVIKLAPWNMLGLKDTKKDLIKAVKDKFDDILEILFDKVVDLLLASVMNPQSWEIFCAKKEAEAEQNGMEQWGEICQMAKLLGSAKDLWNHFQVNGKLEILMDFISEQLEDETVFNSIKDGLDEAIQETITINIQPIIDGYVRQGVEQAGNAAVGGVGDDPAKELRRKEQIKSLNNITVRDIISNNTEYAALGILTAMKKKNIIEFPLVTYIDFDAVIGGKLQFRPSLHANWYPVIRMGERMITWLFKFIDFQTAITWVTLMKQLVESESITIDKSHLITYLIVMYSYHTWHANRRKSTPSQYFKHAFKRFQKLAIKKNENGMFNLNTRNIGGFLKDIASGTDLGPDTFIPRDSKLFDNLNIAYFTKALDVKKKFDKLLVRKEMIQYVIKSFTDVSVEDISLYLNEFHTRLSKKMFEAVMTYPNPYAGSDTTIFYLTAKNGDGSFHLKFKQILEENRTHYQNAGTDKSNVFSQSMLRSKLIDKNDINIAPLNGLGVGDYVVVDNNLYSVKTTTPSCITLFLKNCELLRIMSEQITQNDLQELKRYYTNHIRIGKENRPYEEASPGFQTIFYTLKYLQHKFVEALGVKWRYIGTTAPNEGTELINKALAKALNSKREFTVEEWRKFQISDLVRNNYIKSGNDYYVPVLVESNLAFQMDENMSKTIESVIWIENFLGLEGWIKAYDMLDLYEKETALSFLNLHPYITLCRDNAAAENNYEQSFPRPFISFHSIGGKDFFFAFDDLPFIEIGLSQELPGITEILKKMKLSSRIRRSVLLLRDFVNKNRNQYDVLKGESPDFLFIFNTCKMVHFKVKPNRLNVGYYEDICIQFVTDLAAYLDGEDGNAYLSSPDRSIYDSICERYFYHLLDQSVISTAEKNSFLFFTKDRRSLNDNDFRFKLGITEAKCILKPVIGSITLQFDLQADLKMPSKIRNRNRITMLKVIVYACIVFVVFLIILFFGLSFYSGAKAYTTVKNTIWTPKNKLAKDDTPGIFQLSWLGIAWKVMKEHMNRKILGSGNPGMLKDLVSNIMTEIVANVQKKRQHLLDKNRDTFERVKKSDLIEVEMDIIEEENQAPGDEEQRLVSWGNLGIYRFKIRLADNDEKMEIQKLIEGLVALSNDEFSMDAVIALLHYKYPTGPVYEWFQFIWRQVKNTNLLFEFLGKWTAKGAGIFNDTQYDRENATKTVEDFLNRHQKTAETLNDVLPIVENTALDALDNARKLPLFKVYSFPKCPYCQRLERLLTSLEERGFLKHKVEVINPALDTHKNMETVFNMYTPKCPKFPKVFLLAADLEDGRGYRRFNHLINAYVRENQYYESSYHPMMRVLENFPNVTQTIGQIIRDRSSESVIELIDTVLPDVGEAAFVLERQKIYNFKKFIDHKVLPERLITPGTIINTHPRLRKTLHNHYNCEKNGFVDPFCGKIKDGIFGYTCIQEFGHIDFTKTIFSDMFQKAFETADLKNKFILESAASLFAAMPVHPDNVSAVFEPLRKQGIPIAPEMDYIFADYAMKRAKLGSTVVERKLARVQLVQQLQQNGFIESLEAKIGPTDELTLQKFDELITHARNEAIKRSFQSVATTDQQEKVTKYQRMIKNLGKAEDVAMATVGEAAEEITLDSAEMRQKVKNVKEQIFREDFFHGMFEDKDL